MSCRPSLFAALSLFAAGAAHAQVYVQTNGTSTYSGICSSTTSCLANSTSIWDTYYDTGPWNSSTKNDSRTVTLPFPFTYDANTCTTATISSNGYLTFDGSSAENCPSCSANVPIGTSAGRPTPSPRPGTSP